jgi:hypothetical protein
MIQDNTLLTKTAVAVKVAILKHYRPLKWNEVVSRGDFVEDGHQGFEPWEGPSGFRASSFVKQIFRRQNRRPSEVRKSE